MIVTLCLLSLIEQCHDLLRLRAIQSAYGASQQEQACEYETGAQKRDSPGLKPRDADIFTRMHEFTAVHRGTDYIARSSGELQ